MPVWLSLSDHPGVEVARIEPSVTISDHGSGEVLDPLPVLDATEASADAVSFEFTNETGSDLEDLRVGVVCYDSSGDIVGGTSAYPSLAAAGQTIRIDPNRLAVSENPASCKAHLNYGVF